MDRRRLLQGMLCTTIGNGLCWGRARAGRPANISVGQSRAEVAAGVVPSNPLFPLGNVLRYGADPSGTTSSTLAIQTAIDLACAVAENQTSAGSVYFPAGVYLITHTLDCTNTRMAGSRLRDGLRLYGESAGSTILLGQTGNTASIIETTGSQWFSMSDLQLRATGERCSTVGIFQGVSEVLPQTQNQSFERILIFMSDRPEANGGIGSVALWNFGAEETTYASVYLHANLPFLATAHNPTRGFSSQTPTSYQTLAQSHSVGVNAFSGECFFGALNRRSPSIVTEDVNSLKIDDAYLGQVSDASRSTGSNDSAWKVFGALQGMDYSGTIEGHARALEVAGAVIGARMRATFGGVNQAALERICLKRGGQGWLLDSEFNFQDAVSPDRPLLAAVPSSPGEHISCYVQNTTFRVDCDKRYVAVPENLLGNAKTGNVAIEARDGSRAYRFAIDATGRQEISIASVELSGSDATATQIVRLSLPSAESNTAFSAELLIEGILVAARRVHHIEWRVDVDMGETGGVTLSDPAAKVRGAVRSDIARARRDEVLLTAVSQPGSVFIAVAWDPGKKMNGQKPKFVGRAQMRWSGTAARGPSIQIVS